METQKAPKSRRTGSAEKTFLESLRADRKFRIDAKRIGLIAITALIVDTTIFALIRFGLYYDANTYTVILFASFVATWVVVSAIACFVIRVVDEFLSFLSARMKW